MTLVTVLLVYPTFWKLITEFERCGRPKVKSARTVRFTWQEGLCFRAELVNYAALLVNHKPARLLLAGQRMVLLAGIWHKL